MYLCTCVHFHMSAPQGVLCEGSISAETLMVFLALKFSLELTIECSTHKYYIFVVYLFDL